MRLWITLAFAAIAAVTAIVVTSIFAARSESALQGSAQDFALGNTINVADAMSTAIGTDEIRSTATAVANQRRLAIWVFDSQGVLMTPHRSRRAEFSTIPARFKAIHIALSGDR